MKNPKFNGERLKSARTYRGLTLQELADKIGVKKQAISLYENGKIIPEPEKLFNLIKNLKFPKEYFFQESLNVQTATTYFRALLTTNKKDRNQQVEKIKYLTGFYKVLNNYIDFPKLNLPEDIDTDRNSIEEIAMELREYWELDDKPIKNLVFLLEKNGIVVTSCPTETTNVDAFSQLIKVDGEDRFFVVLSEDKQSATRTQFDAAHELGHILLHPWSEDIETLSREEFKEREKQANEFAAAFLLPKDSFIEDLLYPTNLNFYIELKKKWRTSISAMIMRARNLEVLSFNQYQYLMRQMAMKGWKKREPMDDTLKITKPTLLSKAVDLLLDNEVFDKSSFIQEFYDNNLALDSEEIENLLSLEKGKLSINISPEKNVLSLKMRTPYQNEI